MDKQEMINLVFDKITEELKKANKAIDEKDVKLASNCIYATEILQDFCSHLINGKK